MNRRCELLIVMMILTAGCGQAGGAKESELQRVKSGTLDVVLLSTHEGLRHGKDTFIIEFRSTSSGQLVDVGNVRAAANMPMPGMPMFGTIDVQRTAVAGRYAANGQFDMVGTWRMTIAWDGPAGRGSVNFSGNVQ